MMTMCWMGEPFDGETVLAGTGDEGAKTREDWQPGSQSSPAATAAAEPSPVATRNLPRSRILRLALDKARDEAEAERKPILFTDPPGGNDLNIR